MPRQFLGIQAIMPAAFGPTCEALFSPWVRAEETKLQPIAAGCTTRNLHDKRTVEYAGDFENRERVVNDGGPRLAICKIEVSDHLECVRNLERDSSNCSGLSLLAA
jgi:hypothetical protein